MISKKLTLAADGKTATVVDATYGDVLTSKIDPSVVVTGALGFIGEAITFLGGMGFQSYRMGNGINPWA
jgi:phage host-nuclease inhibitor protein Gam